MSRIKWLTNVSHQMPDHTTGLSNWRSGYDFLYWFKRASGASALRAALRAVLAHSEALAPRAPHSVHLPTDAGSLLRAPPGRLHSLPSRRPDRPGCARRCPTSSALRVAPPWPPATLDLGHRRAVGRLSGRWFSSGQAELAHPLRTPDRWRASPGAPCSRCRHSHFTGGKAFAMRRSGVRIPSAPPPDAADLHRRARARRHGPPCASCMVESVPPSAPDHSDRPTQPDQ
jgi:hypothetical protein